MPISPVPGEREYKKPLIDRLPTVRGLGRTAMFVAGIGVGIVLVAKDAAVSAINKVGDAYMELEYGEKDEKSSND